MTWSELAIGPVQSFGESEFVIRCGMNKREYSRRVARDKLPLSDQNKMIRKQWPKDYLHQAEKDWGKILLTDESWILDELHTRTRIITNMSFSYCFKKGNMC